MTSYEIWAEFCVKMKNDSLTENDFDSDISSFLAWFLTGDSTKHRREKFLCSPAKMFDCEDKKCVILDCPDDEYRFDFIEENNSWKLCFIEGITLPVDKIDNLPYKDFKSLPEKEIWINTERNISKTVHYYCKLKDLLGADEALEWFLDGAGEFLCAKSWVPFYKESKAFIIFSAWIENRINGETVSVDVFTDSRCEIRFIDHLWFKVYHTASHIKPQITLDEYKNIFEYIWKDRAKHAGWSIEFEYTDKDTHLIFISE